MMLTEIMGYMAMAGVLLSFFMKDIKKLRIINTIGCTFFVIYGFMLDPKAWPIIITNAIIIIVNLYYLLKPAKSSA